MCGIVGFTGAQQAAPILLSGLSRLEYRGYDSAGMAVRDGNGEIRLVKAMGRLRNLWEKTDGGSTLKGCCGIGHTRWATHGEPSENNAHPHLSMDRTVVAVHNGIVENYQEIREKLQKNGYHFYSQTDTEVMVNLVEYYYRKYRQGPVDALSRTMMRVRGSYALAVLFEDCPDEIYAIRKDSPMIIGIEGGESFLASDVPAILHYTRHVYYVGNMEIAHITKGKAEFFNIDREPVEKELVEIRMEAEAAEKGGFEHFMMKEIHEQPKAVRDMVHSIIHEISEAEAAVTKDTVTEAVLAEASVMPVNAAGGSDPSLGASAVQTPGSEGGSASRVRLQGDGDSAMGASAVHESVSESGGGSANVGSQEGSSAAGSRSFGSGSGFASHVQHSGKLRRRLDLSETGITSSDLLSISRIYIIACGSAYHVGMALQYILEGMARIPVRVELASEFRYRKPILDESGLAIIISQSGETADSLAALREAKRQGIRTLGIVNVVGSSIAREADNVFYTLAGPEIAVATTKAYSTQLIAGYALAIEFARVRNCIDEVKYQEMLRDLWELPEKMERVLEDKERIQWFAAKYANARDVFFIGRGIDYAIGMEGSLKLKEISYIHSEAYAAGELKHGTISLIEKGILVIGILTQPDLFEKTVSNMVEVKSRGGYLMGLTSYGNYNIEDTANFTVYVPSTNPWFATSLAIIPLQLFAYYVSVAKGLDVDKPRNLAKSVTVE